MPEEPAFEIHSGDRVALIYASGTIAYLEAERPLSPYRQIIVNRIPQLIAKAVAAAVGQTDT